MKLDLRPSGLERLVRSIGLAFVVIIGLQILWGLVAPWLPIMAVVVAIGALLRLAWAYYSRW